MAEKKVKKVVYSSSIGNPFHGNKPTVRRKNNLKR
tara:strand:+ start:326 stop:430 length:105 start_codon:yes stop_codon:yes gene_type:complete